MNNFTGAGLCHFKIIDIDSRSDFEFQTNREHLRKSPGIIGLESRRSLVRITRRCGLRFSNLARTAQRTGVKSQREVEDKVFSNKPAREKRVRLS